MAEHAVQEDCIRVGVEGVLEIVAARGRFLSGKGQFTIVARDFPKQSQLRILVEVDTGQLRGRWAVESPSVSLDVIERRKRGIEVPRGHESEGVAMTIKLSEGVLDSGNPENQGFTNSAKAFANRAKIHSLSTDLRLRPQGYRPRS